METGSRWKEQKNLSESTEHLLFTNINMFSRRGWNTSQNEWGTSKTLQNTNFPQEFYHPIHGWLAMLVCVVGTLFNLANILVLTHKDMRNPVNMILTGIAVADFLVMLEYIPFTIYMNLLDTENRSPEEEVSKNHSWLLLLLAKNDTYKNHEPGIICKCFFGSLSNTAWLNRLLKFTK